jgi:hypothetical protein
MKISSEKMFPCHQIAASCHAKSAWIREDDPEFACWLKREYKPIAGGWQY